MTRANELSSSRAHPGSKADLTRSGLALLLRKAAPRWRSVHAPENLEPLRRGHGGEALFRLRSSTDGKLMAPSTTQLGDMYSRRYQLYVIALLTATYVCSYLDRQILALLMEPIKREIELSDTQMGFLTGPAFVMFYATLSVPIARMADKGNRVTIISICCAIWSAMTALCGAALSFTQLLLARVGVGIGEAGCTPPAQSLICDYVSRTERTRALSIYMLGIPLGVLAGYLLGGWISEGYGWRAAFFMVGAPGVLLAVLIKLTIKEPLRKLGATHGADQDQRPPLKDVFRALWQSDALRHLVLAMTLIGMIRVGTLTWLPSFFMRIHQMGIAEVGTWLALITGLGGGLGTWMAGYLFGRSGRSEAAQVRLLAISAALIVPALAVVLLAPSKHLALAALIPAEILLYSFNGPYFSLVQTLSDARMRATMAAIVMFIQLLFGGSVGVQMIGVLSDLSQPSLGVEGLRWVMLGVSPLLLWGAVHLGLAARFLSQNSEALTADVALKDRYEPQGSGT
jgi:predicted MFS family arabinose efflux permease